jgi:hypothetical protein
MGHAARVFIVHKCRSQGHHVLPEKVFEETIMADDFRKLNEQEQRILEALLEVEFPGQDQWRTQLDSMAVKQVIEDGTLILRPGGGVPLPTHQTKLSVEGMYQDADGGEVAILLHADGKGFLRMLEILKYNGSPIQSPPRVGNIRVLPPENPGLAPPTPSGAG